MDKPGTDILQIRKYLNGELDAKAMHQLERKAQDDPFLMDALEGYEMSGKNQQPNLDLLKAQLNNRTSRKESRIIPWTTINIAAGIVGFMIVLGLFYRNNNAVQPPLTAQVQLPKAKLALPDTITSPALAPPDKQKTVVAQLPGNIERPHIASSRTSYNSDTKADAEGPSLSEIAVAPVNSSSKKDSTPMDEMIIGALTRQKDSTEMPLTVAIAKRPVSQTLKGKAEGVTATDSKNRANAYKLSGLNLPAGDAAYLAGIVVNNNGLPMPGVTVKVVGKPDVTQTDAKGGFALPLKKEKEVLDFSYQGYDSQKVSSAKGDSLKVELKESRGNAPLSEVVVAATPEANKNALRPVGGWDTFNNYVKKSAVLPMGTAPGMVTLQFLVDASGSVSNIRVIKGLSPAADKQAISIIRNGGKWTGNTGGKLLPVTKTIEFTVQQ